jgi:hypothetical protein
VDQDRDRAIAALIELIKALDRRVPHVERVGETRIAAEAAKLKDDAMARVDELKRADSARESPCWPQWRGVAEVRRSAAGGAYDTRRN